MWSRLEWAALFLAGPVIWYAHFWLVYLVAEAGCFAAGGSQPPWLVAAILAATLAALAFIAWTTWLAWRRWRSREEARDRSALYFIGFLLGPMFAAATLFVGLPVAYLPPC